MNVTQAGVRRRKRFPGYELARYRHRLASGTRFETLTVYRTVKEALALHRRVEPDWERWTDTTIWSERGKDAAAGGGSPAAVEESLDVFESVEALAEQIPPALLDLVNESIDIPPTEDLDI